MLTEADYQSLRGLSSWQARADILAKSAKVMAITKAVDDCNLTPAHFGVYDSIEISITEDVPDERPNDPSGDTTICAKAAGPMERLRVTL